MFPSRMLSQTSTQPRTSVKKPLYTRLAQEWYLPPMRSTGVTLDYLKKVDSGQVFRVGLVPLNRFLAECKPSQLKRAPFATKDVAYVKLNKFLEEHGQPELGFELGCWPDAEWLFRVARCIDAGNVCQLFEEAVDEIKTNETDSVVLELGKRRVEEQLETELRMKGRPEVQQAVSELQLDRRRAKNREAEINRLVYFGKKLERQWAEDKVKVERSLDKLVRVTLEPMRTRSEPGEWEEYNNKEREVKQK